MAPTLMLLFPGVVMTLVLSLYLVGYLVGLLGNVGGETRTKYASNIICSG